MAGAGEEAAARLLALGAGRAPAGAATGRGPAGRGGSAGRSGRPCHAARRPGFPVSPGRAEGAIVRFHALGRRGAGGPVRQAAPASCAARFRRGAVLDRRQALRRSHDATAARRRSRRRRARRRPRWSKADRAAPLQPSAGSPRPPCRASSPGPARPSRRPAAGPRRGSARRRAGGSPPPAGAGRLLAFSAGVGRGLVVLARGAQSGSSTPPSSVQRTTCVGACPRRRSGRITTGACSPLAPCTVMIRTASAPLSASRFTSRAAAAQPVDEALQARRVRGARRSSAAFSTSSSGSAASGPRRAAARSRCRCWPGPPARLAQHLGQQRVRGDEVGAARRRGEPIRGAAFRRVRRRARAVERAAQSEPARPCARPNSCVLVQPDQRRLQQRGELQVVLGQQQRVAERQQVLHRDLLDQLQAVHAADRHVAFLQRAHQPLHEGGAAADQHQDVARPDAARRLRRSRAASMPRAGRCSRPACGRCARRRASASSASARRRPAPAASGTTQGAAASASAAVRSSGHSSTRAGMAGAVGAVPQHRRRPPPRPARAGALGEHRVDQRQHRRGGAEGDVELHRRGTRPRCAWTRSREVRAPSGRSRPRRRPGSRRWTA